MGGAVFPPCSLAWGQTMVGVMAATSFKRTLANTSRTVAVSAPDLAAGHCWPMPPPETPGHSWASLGQSLVGSLLLNWLCQRLWLCGSLQTGKFFKRWEYQTTWPAFWEICMQVKKQRLELDMEQQPGSKLGKEYVKAVCCHPAYLTHMQSTSSEMLGWMKHKLESRLPGDLSITLDMQITTPIWQKAKKN